MASLISPPCHSFETSSKLASGVCLRRNNNTAQLLRYLWNRIVSARGHCVNQPLRASMPQVQPISLFSVWFESIQPMLNFGPSEPLKLSRMEALVAVLAHFGCASVAEIGPLQANKKHSFHNWRGKERREALSIWGAERSRRGAEASTARFWGMRRAELHKRD
jgi:hypothetical protein